VDIWPVLCPLSDYIDIYRFYNEKETFMYGSGLIFYIFGVKELSVVEHKLRVKIFKLILKVNLHSSMIDTSFTNK